MGVKKPRLAPDGGHVYPAEGDGGLTVRDYFAGQALASLAQYRDVTTPALRADLAARCYEIADAMLAQRARMK